MSATTKTKRRKTTAKPSKRRQKRLDRSLSDFYAYSRIPPQPFGNSTGALAYVPPSGRNIWHDMEQMGYNIMGPGKAMTEREKQIEDTLKHRDELAAQEEERRKAQREKDLQYREDAMQKNAEEAAANAKA